MSTSCGMRIHSAIILVLIMLTALTGCDQGGGNSSGGSSAPAPSSPAPAPVAAAPILTPFQGQWHFNQAKTLAQWRAGGVAASEIAEAQAIAAQFPLHEDMRIESDLAILLPSAKVPMEGSYQFFALHAHPQWVCGKAWHHEDRHDPGDMDKYYVRLAVVKGDLHLSVRIPEDAADPADPDVTTTPLLADSAANCPANAAPTPPWSAWRTYVFDRGGETPHVEPRAQD